MAETIEAVRSSVIELQDEIRSLTEIEDITPEQDERLTVALDEIEARSSELEALETRAKRIAAAEAISTERSAGFDAPQIMRRVDPKDIDVRTLSKQELRSNAMAIIEKEGSRLTARQLDHVDSVVRSQNGDTDGALIARRILITETPEYRSAFMKGITQAQPQWLPEEVRALQEFRAMSDGVNSSGGYGVPVLIDPSIILNAGATGTPVLDLARTVTITTNAWKGVAAGPTSWSFDPEGSAVSDDTSTFVQPNIPVYSGRGFIPFSYEIEGDYPGFAPEMAMLLSEGYIDLLANKTINGTGSNEPTGVFVSVLAGGATNQIVTTTDGVFGAIDIQNLYKGLPERWRSKSTFLMNVQVENQVRAFPTSSNFGYYTVNLAADGIGVLQGRDVRTSDYCPQYTGTTGGASIALLGDFSNFVIAQRAGMNVELVQNLFDTTTGRPTGQRGWFAFSRIGFDCATKAAFRILVNT